MVNGGCPLFVELAVKLVPARWKRIQPRDPLEINIVVRFLGVLERILRRTSPAIGLGTEVGQFRNRTPQESRHLKGDSFSGNAIYIFVSFISPPKNVGALQAKQSHQRTADQLATGG